MKGDVPPERPRAVTDKHEASPANDASKASISDDDPGIRPQVVGAFDFSGARKGLQQFADNLQLIAAVAAKGLRNIGKALAPLVEALPAILEEIRQRQLLPNWELIDWPLPSKLEEILIDDGLALAWVPPNRILKRILSAPDRAARRKVVGGSWEAIVDACSDELAGIRTTDLRNHTRYALEAAEAIKAGHVSAGQALATNVLDTLLLQRVDDFTRARVTIHKRGRLDMSAYELREAVVWGGIFGAHTGYDGRGGEAVPYTFTRHGSVHSVSPRQYSRVNAVIALMHTVALLRLLDTGVAPTSTGAAVKSPHATLPL